VTMRIKNPIAAVFDRTASRYDRIGPAIFSYFGNHLVEMAGIYKGMKVLDVGTGRGAILFPAAQKVGQGGCVVGIDISREMVRQTELQVIRSNLKNAHILHMDAQHLSFMNGVFDYVLCGFSLFFFLQPSMALKEFKRVLGRKGVVAVNSRALDTETLWLGELIERFVPMEAYRGNNHEGKNPLPNLNSPTGIESALHTAGFTVARIIEEQVSFIYQSEEEWWEAQWANGLRRCLETMNPDHLERFKSETFKKLGDYKTKEGICMPFRAIAAIGVVKR
jgi:ubiquinone/menaquinone biosynthesis C-methylase UbiE